MDTMLAREPIFDHQEKILGYQIFHHDREAEGSGAQAVQDHGAGYGQALSADGRGASEP